MEKIPYTKTLRAISDGVALFYVMDQPIPSGMWLCVQHMTVENATLNFNNIRVGQGTSPSDAHWWEDRPVPAAAVLYEFEETFFVQEGHRVIVRLDGTAAGNILNVYIDGYTWEKVLPGRPFRARKMEE
jgi:hypothetical protein